MYSMFIRGLALSAESSSLLGFFESSLKSRALSAKTETKFLTELFYPILKIALKSLSLSSLSAGFQNQPYTFSLF